MKFSIYKRCFMPLVLSLFTLVSMSQTTEIQYLSGKGNSDTVEWDFYCSGGRNSGKWSKIPVPSNWELHGFGTFNYGHDEDKADEYGLYRYNFTIPNNWTGKKIDIVFGGAMTDTEVKINGKSAGPVHQGGYYQFKYDVTSLVKRGKNSLEVKVNKMSSNASVNMAERKADFWVFGGIFRPVWLEAYPSAYIDHIAIDAKADGSLRACVILQGIKNRETIEARVESLSGESAGSLIKESVKGDTLWLHGQFDSPALWTPEFPNLYELQVSLIDKGEIIHVVKERFGFRTIEVKLRDGIYVNGEKIKFKGVNRHTFWPTSGRTTSREISIDDVKLIKEMNMNAVRMSHYPPDSHFLDICDSLGLFVLNELTSWQAPPYDTEVGRKLVRELVMRDVNHPSVVMWNNGNEGGFNFDLLPEYPKYDPQNRPIIHPRSILNGINANHYIRYNYGVNTFFHGKDIFLPTEFNHGLYDGGHGAGLKDYWDLLYSNPLAVGGFLWDFCDQGILRADKGGVLDTDGNHGADGIMGPYREKEGSFYSIKEIWSPVYFEKKIITPDFNGVFKVENRYLYTNLNLCEFSYEFKRFNKFSSEKSLEGKIASPEIAPGDKGSMVIDLPNQWDQYDVLYITAKDQYGKEIYTWSWNIALPEEICKRSIIVGGERDKVAMTEQSDYITLSANLVEARFNNKTGLIEQVKYGEKVIPLTNGPVLIDGKCSFEKIEHYQSEDNQVLKVSYTGRHRFNFTWTMYPSGLLKLDYDYRQTGTWPIMGITFNFPEAGVEGAKLLANGPYRVWKNRLEGVTFGSWEKKYNNTVTGESWDYPEFKGYYSNFYGANIFTADLSFTVFSASEELFLHLFTPDSPVNANNNNTIPPFPSGDVSFLHGIPPIGTKFLTPEEKGPQGQNNMYYPNSDQPNLKGTLYFDFSQNNN